MEQSVLRASPMPGRWRSESVPPEPVERAPAGRPHGARRRGRRLRSVVFSLSVGSALVLSGIGVGAVGTSALGLGVHGGKPQHAVPPAAAPAPTASGTADTRSGATLGLEAVDDGRRTGALVTAVHVPGPGYTAGLVRGDALVRFGTTPIATAADLARAVARARPGAEVAVTVRHQDGTQQRLTAVPGVVT
ncbi:PDZ domain-containing protein [Streptomyces sp. DSM 110735]|uniref:PDZ domain-containing protein n=1 Tax=Streptomyces sp. DSM 110735 TaxID=2775031 RepID=UPI0018F475C5|nr:PDZ domain-containing protein [Streptomyces sp. DSM 110735]MBJ7904224.1 PDZ domain-containing protein [Streptomyces sp. DSM 110735]